MAQAPQRFRKKPIVIEALQFDGSDSSVDRLHIFGGKKFQLVDPEDRGDDPDILAEVLDDLHSTWVGVKQGQWIVKGTKGEFYPCDPEVFEATYEPV